MRDKLQQQLLHALNRAMMMMMKPSEVPSRLGSRAQTKSTNVASTRELHPLPSAKVWVAAQWPKSSQSTEGLSRGSFKILCKLLAQNSSTFIKNTMKNAACHSLFCRGRVFPFLSQATVLATLVQQCLYVYNPESASFIFFMSLKRYWYFPGACMGSHTITFIREPKLLVWKLLIDKFLKALLHL